MFDYIYGKIEKISEKKIVSDISGIGFEINIPENSGSKLQIGEKTKIFVKLHIKDEEIKIYGFLTEIERTMFEKLQMVGGIGPATALNILSSVDPQALREAILSEDISIFKKIKGVGPKTSQRIVLELKGDMQKMTSSISLAPKDDLATQAIKALTHLGYQQQNASLAVEKALSNLSNRTIEDLIREALKHLT